MISRMRDGTGQRHYRYLYEDVDRHGNVRIYFWRGKRQPKIRMKSQSGTDEFDREYRTAFSAQPATESLREGYTALGTLRWLCEQYYVSAAFQRLGDSTRKVRRGILNDICQKVGALPFKRMEPQHVAKLRDEKATAPEGANGRVKALRQLFEWATSPEYRHTDRNPAREVGYLRSHNPDGFKAWTEADVTAFETQHPIGTQPRLALDLLLYTGVRRSDVVRLGPQMERGNKLVFTETKGRDRVVKTHELPILPPLRVSIDATPTGHLVYLATVYGKPRSVKGFGGWFKRHCRAAGLEDVSAHGLRKLGAQRCAEAGATEYQLMALFGWTSTKQAGVYTRKANRVRLEGEAAPFLSHQTFSEKIRPKKR
jgi:integrase